MLGQQIGVDVHVEGNINLAGKMAPLTSVEPPEFSAKLYIRVI